MTTSAELTVTQELTALRENAALLGWELRERDGTTFVVGFPAHDGTTYWCKVLCDGYPAAPPAWHWYDPATDAVNQPADTPDKGGFFHGNGVICAPWNRLAYKSVDG
jgi:hypothetical protein